MIVNNADRKGAHILAMPGGHRHGVDHGLTFHVHDKLRTVLWGRLGEAERDGVGRVLDGLDGELGRGLGELLSAEEVEALAERCAQLLDDLVFPAPSGLMPAVPWPLF